MTGQLLHAEYSSALVVPGQELTLRATFDVPDAVGPAGAPAIAAIAVDEGRSMDRLVGPGSVRLLDLARHTRLRALAMLPAGTPAALLTFGSRPQIVTRTVAAPQPADFTEPAPSDVLGAVEVLARAVSGGPGRGLAVLITSMAFDIVIKDEWWPGERGEADLRVIRLAAPDDSHPDATPAAGVTVATARSHADLDRLLAEWIAGDTSPPAAFGELVIQPARHWAVVDARAGLRPIPTPEPGHALHVRLLAESQEPAFQLEVRVRCETGHAAGEVTPLRVAHAHITDGNTVSRLDIEFPAITVSRPADPDPPLPDHALQGLPGSDPADRGAAAPTRPVAPLEPAVDAQDDGTTADPPKPPGRVSPLMERRPW